MGCIVTGRLGTGLVVAKLPDGSWSAPSAIATAGIGWGAQIGGEVTDFVIILNTRGMHREQICYVFLIGQKGCQASHVFATTGDVDSGQAEAQC